MMVWIKFTLLIVGLLLLVIGVVGAGFGALLYDEMRRVWQWICIAIFIFGIAMLCAVTLVNAHEWYPPFCCSGSDCVPLAAERVQALAGGYLIDGKFFISGSQARLSQDGRYHGCFPNPEKLHCLFVPLRGS